MGKMFVHLIIFLVIAIAMPVTGNAKTGYVSDMLLLTFRQGPGNTYKVLKTLKSNTQVTVIEEEDGYYKVELQSGDIGWVDKKFIIFDLPSAIIASRLEAKNKALEAKVTKLLENTQSSSSKIVAMENEYTSQIDSLNSALKKSQQENAALTKSLNLSQNKYDTLINQSKNIHKIVQENKALQEQNKTLSRDFESLQIKHKNSFRTAMIKWFLAGVAVLLAGWLLGKSVSRNKRGSGSLLS